MRAIEISEPGGPEQLRLTDRPKPVPGPGEVLVRVAAAGVNRADVLQRQGFYNPPPGATDIPGLEVAGTVEALGTPAPVPAATPVSTGTTPADSPEYAPALGDRVAALLSGGGYAEYVTVPAGQLIPLPDDMSFTDAAALPEVLSTVYSNVFAGPEPGSGAHLAAGQWLLVHGGGSGIGTCAIQMARVFGAKVAVTVGSARKAEFCRELGADAVIDYKTEDFVTRIKEVTAAASPTDAFGEPRKPGADVIFDVIGAKYLERNIRALTTGGRLSIIGLQGGVKAEINLNALMTGRKSVMGTTLRARPAGQKAAIVSEVRRRVWPQVLAGAIRPIVHRVLPLGEAGAAQTLLEDGTSIGKVVLDVADAHA